MKRVMCFAAAAALALLCGCASEKLRNGEYRIDRSSRDDFAVVYNDLIFLHIESPELAQGNRAYWEWAGKYEIGEDGEIEFAMDHEMQRRWKFYFQFVRKNDGIGINDFARQTGFLLRYKAPRVRRRAPGPRPAGAAGNDQIQPYQDLSR